MAANRRRFSGQLKNVSKGPLTEAKANGHRSKYLIALSEGKWVCQTVCDALRGCGLSCKAVELGAHGTGVLVSADTAVLIKQAELLEWSKQVVNSEEVAMVTAANIPRLVHCEDNCLFTAAEEVKLLQHLIQDTPVDKDELKKRGVKLAQRKDFISCLSHCSPPLISEAYPLHTQADKSSLVDMLKSSFTKELNLQMIRNYFGEEIAFYFSWMNFYTRCALVPALVGVVMYYLRSSEATVDTDPYLPFFSLFMCLWAVLFMVYWRRRSSVNSFQWNTYSLSLAHQLRPGYHGDMVTDPVTKRQTLYYKSWKRKCWYVFSVLAMLPLLAVGLAAMTLSLNLNGYVKNTASPIYVTALAQFAQPGGLFASDSPYYLWLVPTIAHSIVIYWINQVYSRVAEKCTNLENHRTEHRWHSSLVIKRVTFECIDCFMPLFYIAFYQLDIITLRAEIASLFMSDEIRRVVMESVIPFVSELGAQRVHMSKGQKVIPDTLLTDYDQFDDYLEMVVQFGYITLFASALPLGSAVTLIFLYIEARSDLFKLLYAYRRPAPRRTRDIGVWYDVMGAMVFIAILSNCALLGFSSEQLMQWAPSLFDRDSLGGDQVMAVGSGRYVVGLVFSFEHILLVIAIWLQWVIKPSPKWVRLAIARREFLSKERYMRQASFNLDDSI